MKKRMKKWFCIVLTIITCMTMYTPVMAASAKYNAAVSSYRRYMANLWGSNKSYKIVDIDGNGIPELIAHTWTENSICTYNPRTKRTVCVASIGCGKGYYLPILYSKKTHTVMICSASTGGNTKEIYKISGTRAKLVLRAEAFNGKFESGYKVNGRKVSRYTYNKRINKYMKRAVTLTIPR